MHDSISPEELCIVAKFKNEVNVERPKRKEENVSSIACMLGNAFAV